VGEEVEGGGEEEADADGEVEGAMGGCGGGGGELPGRAEGLALAEEEGAHGEDGEFELGVVVGVHGL